MTTEHDPGLDPDNASLDWDTNARVCCPVCGEPAVILIDPAGGMAQEYVEDCQVCCNPWHVRVQYQPSGRAIVTVDTAS